MDIKAQVCNLEYSQKLKELGVLGQGEFVWSHYSKHGQDCWYAELIENVNEDPLNRGCKFIEAVHCFTVAELGVMLPRNFASFDTGMGFWRIANTFNYANANDFDKIGPYYSGNSRTYENITGVTEADVRAAMLIHLIDKKIITAEEVNARLQPYGEQPDQRPDEQIS